MDKIYRNAAMMCILQIGELAGRLSSEFIATHPSRGESSRACAILPHTLTEASVFRMSGIP